MERKRLHSLEFGKMWVSIARLCQVKVSDLEWHFDTAWSLRILGTAVVNIGKPPTK